MSAAEGLDFAPELKVTADGFIREDAKTVYHGEGISCPGDDIVRTQVKVGFVRDSKDKRFHALERFGEVPLDLHVL